jgi:hypothetical protein
MTPQEDFQQTPETQLPDPRFLFEGVDSILERCLALPMQDSDRNVLILVHQYSSQMAHYTWGGKHDKNEYVRIFQNYLSAVQVVCENDRYWENLPEYIPSSELLADKAREFLSDPDSYLGPVSATQRQQTVDDATAIVQGTSKTQLRGELKKHLADLQLLALAGLEGDSKLKDHAPTTNTLQ